MIHPIVPGYLMRRKFEGIRGSEQQWKVVLLAVEIFAVQLFYWNCNLAIIYSLGDKVF